jgi:hypothetical protein
MDAQLPQDFLALFPSEGQKDGGSMQLQQHGHQHQGHPHSQSSHEHDLQQQQMSLGYTQHSTNAANQQLNLDMLLMGGNMQQMQDMSGATNGNGQSGMLDQHVKLARLKLLQVQHEILQQQVCPYSI